jgi:uncharacterized protein (TIGR03435 family)
MKFILQGGIAVLTFGLAASQPAASARLEFEVASIKAAAPQTGHFPPPASSRGGPGTSDPALFRCLNCNLSFLITKAFDLQRYQFPGQSSLPDQAFDISATVPAGTTPEQLVVMLQNLLKDRFNLAGHFESKAMQGYELVVAKNGPTLQESKEPASSPGANLTDGHAEGDWHSFANGSIHGLTRPGLMFFNGQAKYRGDHQTTGDLARMISAQLAKPVDDRTGLKGNYDFSLSWSDDGSHAASHPAGWGGFGDHADRGGAPQGTTASDVGSGPTLIGAVQAQLGLKLQSKKATANIFIVDHVDRSPIAN